MKSIYIILLIILGVILAVVYINQIAPKNEIDSLKGIIPSGWTLTEESISEDIVAKFIVTSDTECSREITRKPIPELVTETINPFITITYENKWAQEDYNAESKRNEDCQKLIEGRPVAVACIKRNPSINTKSYSIFITESKCDDETSELKNLILNYFEKFK